MPEYLAPDVYVEEVDTGSKPIEGVSTSTGAMVGVTERGPVNIPIFVSSFGEYQRWFGGYLPIAEFGANAYLPHAVEGFFANGGKRLFIVRVLDGAAAASTARLFQAGRNPVETRILQLTSAGDNDIYLLDGKGIGVTSPPTWLRIGAGSSAEYRTVQSTSTDRIEVPMQLPMAAPHASGTTVEQVKPKFDADVDLALSTVSGTSEITLPGTTKLGANDLLCIGNTSAPNTEFAFVKSLGPIQADGTRVVVLKLPLQLAHPAGTDSPVAKVTLGAATFTTKLAEAVAAGTNVAFISALDRANYGTAGTVLSIVDGDHSEIRVQSELASVELVDRTNGNYSAGSIVESVQAIDTGSGTVLIAEATAGSAVIVVSRRHGLTAGQVVRLGASGDANREYLVIRDLPNQGLAPDPGRVILATALRGTHAVNSVVQPQTVTSIAPAATSLVVASGESADHLALADTAGKLSAGTLVRVRTPEKTEHYHLLKGTSTALAPTKITLGGQALQTAHGAGEFAGVREPLIDITALDDGDWGDRLRVSVQVQSPPLINTRIRTGIGVVDASHIRLESTTAVEIGTVLCRFNASGEAIGAPFKVLAINRQANNLLTLDAALTPLPLAGEIVRSQEFQLTVQLLQRPEPGVSSRADSVIDTEVFRSLSMDARHSRYVHKVIGTTWIPGNADDFDGNPLRLADRRSLGESRYIRVFDLNQAQIEPARTNSLHSIRSGPEPLIDVLPDGRMRPAVTRLVNGDNSLSTLGATAFVGIDDDEPDKRTGFFSLRNQDDISLVAVPGVTTAAVQQALIEHCELMRYRFVILDGPVPPLDSLNDVRDLRQRYDTKYAALYHPWLLIPDPFPANPVAPLDFPIPPSGHIMGVYADVDVRRGVHKAPANEVVRGIVGLKRTLQKGEQELLNPFPVNINVIRDFRANNRGIRVWGARVITSDPDWKYVNVRRLFNFVEKSVDRGLQWVVFEPNAEPLWARVKRTVSAFLDGVWRDGALEGTKPEQAYFVKVDRTTMTQADIDNGRLIVLVGIAPVKPAEFVIIRIGLFTANSTT